MINHTSNTGKTPVISNIEVLNTKIKKTNIFMVYSVDGFKDIS